MDHLSLEQIVELRIRYSTAMLNDDAATMREACGKAWELAATSVNKECPATLAQIDDLAGAWKNGVEFRTWGAKLGPDDALSLTKVRDLVLSPDEWAAGVKKMDETERLLAVRSMLIDGPVQAKLAISEILNRDPDLGALHLPKNFEQVHTIRVDGVQEYEDEPGAYGANSYVLDIDGPLSLADARELVRSTFEVDPEYGPNEDDHTVVLFNARGDKLSSMDLTEAKIEWTSREPDKATARPNLQNFHELEAETLQILETLQSTFDSNEMAKLQHSLVALGTQRCRIAEQGQIVGHLVAHWSPSPSELPPPSLQDLASVPQLHAQARELRSEAAEEANWDNFETAKGLRYRADRLLEKADLLVLASRILPSLEAAPAQSGQTYSGPIHSLGVDHATQIDIAGDRLVRHELCFLVGAKLAAADHAVVNYPRGPVGLVSLQGDAHSQSAELDHSHSINRNQTQQEFGR